MRAARKPPEHLQRVGAQAPYDDTRYVLEPVTRGVVNTMPEATLRALADHGVLLGDTIRSGDAAAEVMDGLADREHRLRRRHAHTRA